MNTYPEQYRHLISGMKALGEALPETMAGFSALHKAATTSGALSTKTKELAALGMAICVRCKGCIACHVHDALEAGASREEILEIIGVAILMGGGPSMIYSIEAYEALNQFEEATVAIAA